MTTWSPVFCSNCRASACMGPAKFDATATWTSAAAAQRATQSRASAKSDANERTTCFMAASIATLVPGVGDGTSALRSTQIEHFVAHCLLENPCPAALRGDAEQLLGFLHCDPGKVLNPEIGPLGEPGRARPHEHDSRAARPLQQLRQAVVRERAGGDEGPIGARERFGRDDGRKFPRV